MGFSGLWGTVTAEAYAGVWDTSSHPWLLLKEMHQWSMFINICKCPNVHRLREWELRLPGGQLREIETLAEGLFDHPHKWVTTHLLLAPLDISSIWKIAHTLQKSSIATVVPVWGLNIEKCSIIICHQRVFMGGHS